MEFITLNDLRRPAEELRRRLRERKELVLVANGEPIAVISNVDEGRIDETLRALRQARAQLALTRTREAARRSGRDRLTDEEIEAEIAAARRERYERQARQGL